MKSSVKSPVLSTSLPSPTVRKLHAVHRWTGVFLAANLLLLSVTGLLLVFRHEIDDWLGDAPAARSDARPAPLEQIAAAARRLHPEHVPMYIWWEDSRPGIVYVQSERAMPTGAPEARRMALDAATGEVAAQRDPHETFTGTIVLLHAELLLGVPGQIYVGLVGLAFVVLLVTGFVLYGRFTKQLVFGVLRRGTARLGWIDLHKALGAATFLWNLVIATTGALLALGTFLVQLYQFTELASLKGVAAERPASTARLSLDEAMARVGRELPGLQLSSISLPGSEFAGERHYLVLLRGTRPVESRLLTLALVDAASGEVRTSKLPWYLKAVLIAEPLHFGDYGGMPFKVAWAMFSLVTIVLTGSGGIVWIARRRKTRNEAAEPSESVMTSAGAVS